MKITNTTGVYVPAGEYALCDPCYAVASGDWMDLLESSACFNKPVGTIKGFKVYAFSTMYGDGTYSGSDKFIYSVDSGLIGLTPVEYMGEKERSEVFDLKLGTRVVFTADMYCSRSEEGVLKFGSVVIDTGFDSDD